MRKNFDSFVCVRQRSLQRQAGLLSLLETLFSSLKVDHFPDSLEVVSLEVLVLKVEGVFPGVNSDQRDVGCEHQKKKQKKTRRVSTFSSTTMITYIDTQYGTYKEEDPG